MINPAELDLKEENVIRVTRVAKVTSRGKNFRFGALVVIGDGKGHVCGHGLRHRHRLQRRRGALRRRQHGCGRGC